MNKPTTKTKSPTPTKARAPAATAKPKAKPGKGKAATKAAAPANAARASDDAPRANATKTPPQPMAAKASADEAPKVAAQPKATRAGDADAAPRPVASAHASVSLGAMDKPAGDSPAPPPAAAAATTSSTASAASAAASAEPAPAIATAATTPDVRLPAVGTVIQRRDRSGAVVSECVVEVDGIRYAGKVYRSLSAAAVAAAKDRGKATTSANGFTYWGLSKPARAMCADPLAALDRTWCRYVRRMEAALEKARTGEHRERTLAELDRHARVLQNLRDEVA